MQTLTNILLVEDNPRDVALLKHALRRSSEHPWQLAEAETLAAATALFQNADISPFDLILLDLGLPDSQGLNTLKQFCQATTDIPVVVLTGLDDQALALEAVSAGAQDYLVKDKLTLSVLSQSLQFAWRRQQQVNAARSSAKSAMVAQLAEQPPKVPQTEFMGMIFHELRNPLGAIQNALEVLFNESSDPSQRWLQRIQRATDQLLRLMEEMLLLTKVQSDSAHSAHQDFSVNHCCQAIIDSLADPNACDRIDYQITNADLTLHSDPHLLQCILTNLLSNALKYSPDDCAVELIVSAQWGNIQFQITDRGIGIPTADQADLMNSFYRASNVGQIAGTGLGLAIVQRCVELLGGEITIDSVENSGTSVTVTLRSCMDGVVSQ
jgi:signal transduction histidine kinase